MVLGSGGSGGVPRLALLASACSLLYSPVCFHPDFFYPHPTMPPDLHLHLFFLASA